MSTVRPKLAPRFTSCAGGHTCYQCMRCMCMCAYLLVRPKRPLETWEKSPARQTLGWMRPVNSFMCAGLVTSGAPPCHRFASYAPHEECNGRRS